MRRGLIVAFVLCCACAARQRYEPIGARASVDLSCPQSELQTQLQSQGSIADVHGCGKRATYVMSGGQWILGGSELNTNSDGQPLQSDGPPTSNQVQSESKQMADSKQMQTQEGVTR